MQSRTPAAPALETAYRSLRAGRFTEVVALCGPLVGRNVVEAQLLAGLSLAAMGDTDRAAALLTSVAQQRPEHRHPCLDLADLLREHDRAAEMEPHFRAALRLTPDDTRLTLALAAFLADAGRRDEAEAMLRDLTRAQPDLAAAQVQLGILHDDQGRLPEAASAFQAAIRVQPAAPAGWANLGRLLVNEGHAEDGFHAMAEAIRLRPEDPQLHLNRAFALLKAGRLREGWREQEWRFRTPGHTTLPLSRLLPDLDRIPGIAGRTILVTHEEGYGDTLQFLRYVPLLADLGARVLVSVPPALTEVARRVRGAEVVTDTTVSFDWHCPFLSLPRAFGTEMETIPNAMPYLAAESLPRGTGRRIGLVWAGEARPGARSVDARRSAPLSALLPMMRSPAITWVSLQHGPASTQLSALPPGLMEKPMATVRDFHDTAAIIQTLDLVVTVDTATAHLAGGLGTPVFLLDRYDNCWRWLQGRSDSPWYPTLRIFRQTAVHDWGPPVRAIAAAITADRI